MKKLIIAATMLVLYKSSHGQCNNSYTIQGSIRGAKDGTKVFLIKARSKEIDSSIIKKGRFRFEGKLAEPTESAITIGKLVNSENKAKTRLFWLEDSHITFQGNNINLGDAKVTGSASNRDYDTYLNEVSKKLKGSSNDTLKVMLTINYIEKHPDSYKSIMELYLNRQLIPLEKVKTLLSNVSDKLKRDSYGQMLFEFIAVYKELKIGDKAPDFTLPGVNGNDISLSSFRGKYIFLQFWSTWCTGYKFEIPMVNVLYDRYHTKGIEVLGIALDKKDSVMKAIKDEKINWGNVYDPKGYASHVAFTYGILSVPHNLLIDPEGKIVAIETDILNMNDELWYTDRANKSIMKFGDLLKK